MENKDYSAKFIYAFYMHQAATIVPMRSSIFPRILGLETCRKWQRSFFYVQKSTAENLIGLPAFVVGPPTAKLNWGQNPKTQIPEVNLVHQTVIQLKKAGMTAPHGARIRITGGKGLTRTDPGMTVQPTDACKMHR